MRIKCKLCGEEIDCTPNYHIMESCGCGATHVDAERDYTRLMGEWEKIEEE